MFNVEYFSHDIIILSKYIVILILFHSWPESQTTSLPYSGVRSPWRVENADALFLQAGVRGLKVLSPHGAWVTEANCQRQDS